MTKKTIKGRVDDLETKADPTKQPFIGVHWEGDLWDWPLGDGTVEKITREEFIARGGVIVTWDDDLPEGGHD